MTPGSPVGGLLTHVTVSVAGQPEPTDPARNAKVRLLQSVTVPS